MSFIIWWGGWGPGFLLVVVPNGHWVLFYSKTTTRDDVILYTIIPFPFFNSFWAFSIVISQPSKFSVHCL